MVDRAEAETWSRDLMESFRQALEKDPAVDLLSVVGRKHLAAHHDGQYEGLSEASQLNLRTVHRLQDEVLSQPEINLRDNFPAISLRKITSEAKPSKTGRLALQKKIDAVKAASIIYPLSSQASALLNQHLTADDSPEKKSIPAALNDLILNSDIIFQLSIVYAPHCISPLRFPVRWLVDRLLGSLLWNWRTDVVR